MFFDYKKAISKKSMTAIVDSPEIVDYFNKFAPTGTHYIAQPDGSLLLVSKDPIHIDGVELCLTEQQFWVRMQQKMTLLNIWKMLKNVLI